MSTQAQIPEWMKVLAPTIPALLAFLSSLVNRKQIKSLHVEVNQRMSELLKRTAESSHAEGRREGIESKTQGELKCKYEEDGICRYKPEEKEDGDPKPPLST